MTRLRRLCLIVPLLAAGLPAAAGRPMTVEDLWAMERVGSPQLSPDGRRVVFTVSAYDFEKNEGNGDLWLVPADGSAPPRRLTWHEGGDGSPVWSPDGRQIAFVSKRDGDEANQLYVLSLDGGEARRVTKLPVGVQDPKWFPDGKRLAFVAMTWPDLDDWEQVAERVKEQKDDKVKAKITENRLVRYWDHYVTDGRAAHFFVVDVESGEVVDLTPGSRQLLPFWGVAGTWDLSPDGAEICFTANSTPPPYTKLNFDLYLLSTDGGGRTVNITSDNPAFDVAPRYSPDGRWIVYGRNRRPEIAPDFTRLARYDRRAKAHLPLAESLDAQPSAWTFAADGKSVFFHAQERGKTHLYRVKVPDGKPQVVVRGKTTGNVQAGPGGRLVFLRQSITEPAELYVAAVGGGEPRPITAFNADRLSELDLGRVEDTRFEGADGDDVQMFVIYPPGFDRNEKWPLLHLVHGGPHGAWRDAFHYRWNAALFAAPGYVTTAVNFHGSTGSGQAFAESILGAHADKPFIDMMKATDAMLARGFVDETKMAAAGGSYGGYLVSWILGHTDRFAALVNHAGVYDLMGQFASDWTWSRANNYGAAPWQDPERIDLWSPSRYAKHFNTPTLILHGELDYRVPYTQGLNLHGVLTGKGVPSRLVVFPEENHWILKPQSAKVWWDEVHGWLERYIGRHGEPVTASKRHVMETFSTNRPATVAAGEGSPYLPGSQPDEAPGDR